jgi:hypothetical protein
MANRDRVFQQQLDKVLKKIDKGQEYFEAMWPRIDGADPVCCFAVPAQLQHPSRPQTSCKRLAAN